MVSPARMKRAMSPPITGMRPACAAPTMTDHTAFWSHRSSCPVNASASVSSSSTAPVSQLSSRGILERAHQVGAGDVNADEQHHRRRAEVVHAPQEAAQQRLLGDELEAVVGLAARGHVGRGERDARGHLQHEGDEGGAAEHVPPPGPRRHRVLEGPPRRGDQAAAIVQPGEEAPHRSLRRSGWGWSGSRPGRCARGPDTGAASSVVARRKRCRRGSTRRRGRGT